MRLKRLKELWDLVLCRIRGFNENTKKFNGGRYVRAWIDYILCGIFLGAAPDDYYQYRFYEKSWKERDKFITFRRSRKLIKENGKNAYALVEKDVFNKRFSDFLNRDWMEMKTATADEFAQFLDRHNGKAFMKPLGGIWGKGIFVLTKDEFEKSGRSMEPLRNYIAEEAIVQSSVLSKLNPGCVNSVRVLTYRGEILLCVLKLGTGTAIVDNLHAAGLNGNIDVKTGMTNVPFLDGNIKKYYKHPTTNEELVGVQIPNWSVLIEKVTAAAKRIPELSYLGWDVAILEDDIAIIEVNENPGHFLVQGSAQIGVYDRIREIRKKV